MAMRQANTKASQLIEVNSPLKIPKKEPDNGKQSDDNKFRFFMTLKKSIFLILQQ